MKKNQQSGINQIRLTEDGKSYWEKSGAYQKEIDDLFDTLVPQTGSAETIAGEMVRGVSRLYYDYFNNGNCNVADAEYDDYGNITKVEVHPFYKRFIKLMKDVYTEIYYSTDGDEAMKYAINNLRKIEDIIIDCGYDKPSFSSKSESVYNHMVDYCIYVVTTYQDKVSGKLHEKYPTWEIF